jgi:hypothetical protein
VRCVISDRQDLARDVTQTAGADCVGGVMFGENKEPWRIFCKQVTTDKGPGRLPELVTKVNLLLDTKFNLFDKIPAARQAHFLN